MNTLNEKLADEIKRIEEFQKTFLRSPESDMGEADGFERMSERQSAYREGFYAGARFLAKLLGADDPGFTPSEFLARHEKGEK